MGSHLVARMHPEEEISYQEVIKGYQKFYGDEKYIGGEQVEEIRKRLCSLAAYVKDIKQGFTFYRILDFGFWIFDWDNRICFVYCQTLLIQLQLSKRDCKNLHLSWIK